MLLTLLESGPPSTIRHLDVGFASPGLLGWALDHLNWEAFADVLQRFTRLQTLSFTDCRFAFDDEDASAIRGHLRRLQLAHDIVLRFRDATLKEEMKFVP